MDYLNAKGLKKFNAINFGFKHYSGCTRNIIVSYGTTISQLIRKFFETINFIDSSKKHCLLYNAKQINIEDQTTIENFFKNNDNPKIYFYDFNCSTVW